MPCVKGPRRHGAVETRATGGRAFGGPQDIEWAIQDGKLYLLQSRPITTLEDAEAYEQLFSGTRARLRDAARATSAGRGWSTNQPRRCRIRRR